YFPRRPHLGRNSVPSTIQDCQIRRAPTGHTLRRRRRLAGDGTVRARSTRGGTSIGSEIRWANAPFRGWHDSAHPLRTLLNEAPCSRLVRDACARASPVAYPERA